MVDGERVAYTRAEATTCAKTVGCAWPVQVDLEFTEEHALQCGFCTPGLLMLLAGELAANPELDANPDRLDEVLASNLCRCTGYHGIRRAAVSAARRLRASRADAADQGG